MKISLCRMLVVPALVTAIQPSVVFAQTDGLVLEEVIVTARKRSESVQDVPVAIQAFGVEEIVRYGASNLNEIGDLASQVTVFPNAAGNGANITIRGYGSDSLDPGIEASVGINSDGVQIDRGAISRQAFFDLQSVEVLKGPQALFFGKNSPAGVISLNSALPTDEFEANLGVGFEFEADEAILEGAISGPVSDTLSARFAFRGSDSDGYFENRSQAIENSFGQVFPFPFDFRPGPDRVGAEEAVAGRFTLDWHPNENFNAVARLLVTDLESNGFRTTEFNSCSGPLPSSNTALGPIVDTNGDCQIDGVLSQGSLTSEAAAAFSTDIGDGSARGEFESVLATLNLDWNLGWGSVSSVTGLYDYDFLRFDNFDGTNFFQLPSLGTEEQTQFTQEIRLQTTLEQPLNFVGGVYFETFDRDVDSAATIAALPFGPLIPPIPGFTFFSNTFQSESRVESDSFSVFGQVVWEINDQWELTAGGRYTEDDKEAVQQYVYVHPFAGADAAFLGSLIGAPLQQFLLTQDVPLNSEFDDDDFSPEVTLSWRPADNITYWGAFRTGYKSGGFSTNTIIGVAATGESLTFQPEEADGFEFGVKSILLDGRLRLNATVYDYEFDNQQIGLFDAATVSLSVRNVASGSTTGFELDSQYLVSDKLSVNLQFGYNEGEYDEYPDAPCFTGQSAAQGCNLLTGEQDLSGTPLVRAPELQGALGFDYKGQLNNNWALALAGEVNYTDEYQASSTSNPVGIQDSSTRLNGRISLLSNDGRYQISLIGRNLTDEIIFATANDAPGSISGFDSAATPIRGRQVILELKYAL